MMMYVCMLYGYSVCMATFASTYLYHGMRIYACCLHTYELVLLLNISILPC